MPAPIPPLTLPSELAVVALTPGGVALARRLTPQLATATCYLPQRFATDDGHRYYDEPVMRLLPRLFAAGTPLLCLMATGIVVRALAPVLRGKEHDPAVVVMDEAGRFAISLLAGHLGGANDLARILEARCGATAVITTATDVHQLPAWDTVARELGLTLEPVAHLRRLNRLLLEAGRIALCDPYGAVSARFAPLSQVRLVEELPAAGSGVEGRVAVTHRLLDEEDDLLLLRPRDLVIGVGCNRDTCADEIKETVRALLQQAQLSPASVARFATIEAKRDEAGITEAAARFGVEVDYHLPVALNAVAVPSPPSEHALAAVGARGVCEPAALLSAGARQLLLRKQARGNVTVAIASLPFSG